MNAGVAVERNNWRTPADNTVQVVKLKHVKKEEEVRYMESQYISPHLSSFTRTVFVVTLREAAFTCSFWGKSQF